LRLLLDSNALYWWAREAPALSAAARKAIKSTDAEVFVSAVTPWELAIKHASGKLDCGTLLDSFPEYLREQEFTALEVAVEDGIRAAALPNHHRDPFDRMLVAQAQAKSLWIVSSDSIFEHYGVRRIW
jgi:PIN domain nuclease of toxin-antitoxin system